MSKQPPLTAPLFPDLIKGTFIHRPNRFIIHCATAGGERLGQLSSLAPPPPGHLFHFAENPLERQPLIDLLQHFRIDRLEPSLRL